MKQRFYCRVCGGSDLTLLNRGIWNENTQAWIFDVILEAWCPHCNEHRLPENIVREVGGKEVSLN